MGKYEEALERAKQGMPIDEVFPELAESEDERIRAHVVLVVKDWWRKIAEVTDDGKWPTEEEMLTYLEKQKEQKPALPGFEQMTPEEKMNHPLYLEGFDVGREVERVVSKDKPAEWNEEDKDQMFVVESCLKMIERDYPMEKGNIPDAEMINGALDWFQSLPSRFSLQPHWKPSEEQMRAFGDYIDGEEITEYDKEELVNLYHNLKKLM